MLCVFVRFYVEHAMDVYSELNFHVLQKHEFLFKSDANDNLKN
jgi:hypothetical protein